ncbi:MAG: hypothetical protein JXL97_06205 [Bacteroidales bacterium]|nr:hypothetical protein [Bacteroidales bacterium]
MKRNVLLIYMSTRQETAEKTQKILTGWGCYIKTRLGIHDGVLDKCTDTGLVFIELVGETEKHQEMERKLNLIKGVTANLISMELTD